MSVHGRAGGSEHAERVNAAAELAERGVAPAEAARVLAGRFGCSPRQARRYVDQAAASGRVPVPEASVVFTVKLPAGWRPGAGARPGLGADDLRRGGPGAGGIFRTGPQKPSPQVSGRLVGTECVFDRHGAADLSAAYAILVPQRRARIGRAGQEGRPQHDQRGDLRPGLQRPAEEGRDDRVADRGAARARRALGLDVPEEWVFEDEGHSGATLVRPALEALRDLAAQGCVDVVLVYSPDRLARKFAYQALLMEEFARAGVRVEFIKNGARGDSPKTSCWSSSRACSPSTRRPSSWSGTGAARRTAPAPDR